MKTPGSPRSASGLLVIESRSSEAMQHAKRRSITARWIACLLSAFLVLSFAEIRNHAEETVAVITNHYPTEAHPIYLIAAPPQEKMPPRPLNVPIASPRQTAAKTESASEPALPFPMSAAQAMRIGNGLIEDSDAQAALPYLEYARQQDANSVDVSTGLARCYYELRRDDEALKLYERAAAQHPASWDAQYYLGRTRLAHARYAQAAEPLDNALKLKPDD